MARMKRKRKYRSSAFSKSSWNKRVSCRQNMRKGRIKASYKRRNAEFGIGDLIGIIILYGTWILLGIYWLISEI